MAFQASAISSDEEITIQVDTKTPNSPEIHAGKITPQDIIHQDVHMDGGTRAWLQVLGSWIIFMNTWGITSTFGVFQTYYSAVLLPTMPSSAISWIGSIQAFLTMFSGLLSGYLLDIGYLKHVILAGSVLEVFGMMMTSISSQYYQIILAQVALAVLPLYFQERRMIAAGIAATGSALAGVYLPIMLANLFKHVGFGWATRTLALIMAFTLSIACFIVTPRHRDVKSGPLFNISFMKEPVYLFFVMAFAFIMAANYVPYFYISDYSTSLGIDSGDAFYLVSYMNAASALGRILPALLASRYGGLNTLIGCAVLSSVVLFSFQACRDYASLVVIVVAYCFASGGILFLPPIILANLTKDPSEYGTRIGMGYTIAAIGGLVGNPVAGAAKGHLGVNVHISKDAVVNSFRGIWLVSGGSMTIAFFMLLAMRYWYVGLHLRQKVMHVSVPKIATKSNYHIRKDWRS
ncbi:major facilitator superfamily transporter [Trichoderma velutinum]